MARRGCCVAGAGGPVPRHQNVRRRVAPAEIVFEVLRRHSSLGIHDKCARMRNSVKWRPGLYFLIKNAEGADGFRSLIGQQREGDMTSLREISEHRRAVVTDRRQSQPLLPYPVQVALQLDELVFAVRSPVGRTKKY